MFSAPDSLVVPLVFSVLTVLLVGTQLAIKTFRIFFAKTSVSAQESITNYFVLLTFTLYICGEFFKIGFFSFQLQNPSNTELLTVVSKTLLYTMISAFNELSSLLTLIVHLYRMASSAVPVDPYGIYQVIQFLFYMCVFAFIASVTHTHIRKARTQQFVVVPATAVLNYPIANTGIATLSFIAATTMGVALNQSFVNLNSSQALILSVPSLYAMASCTTLYYVKHEKKIVLGGRRLNNVRQVVV
ncbi:hypothetical protein HDV04_005558 [Boothiomyces sp. JEL0838]|nr:hypothetical protein HDV04_005558 [Boothiomyces sp. JEL0838]